MPGSDPHVHRSFGYVQICWTVEHFWLLSCGKIWKVISPEFDVQTTRWRLLLSPKSKDVSRRHMCAYLERLKSDDGPEVVRAHWNVRLCNCKRQKRCCCHLLREKEQLFRRGDCCHGDVVEDIWCLSSDFKPFETDDLVIECKLVVDDPEVTSEKWWSEADDEGLKSLSDDMFDLFRMGHFSDMAIKVGEVKIPAVRAILCARNETLAEIIGRDISASVIELPADGRCPADSDCHTSPAVNANAVCQLIGYLHHGRLDEILFGEPSISLAECARILGVEEVRTHYIPDELTLTSGLDVEEHVVTWFVTELKEGNVRPVVSPTLIHNSSDEGGLAWSLVLYPRGKEGSGKHVAIYPEASGGGDQARSKGACLELALADRENKFRCYRRLQKPPGETFNGLGVDDFLERPLEWEDGTLQVVFRLRMYDGVGRLSKALRQVTSVTAFPGGGMQPLQNLSKDLKNLLWGNAAGRDFTVICSWNCWFHVHRSIMAARVRNFSSLVGTSDELDLGSMHLTETVSRALLSYIYSGQLEEEFAVELLLLAEYLDVDALHRTCSRIVDEDRANFVPRILPSSPPPE